MKKIGLSIAIVLILTSCNKPADKAEATSKNADAKTEPSAAMVFDADKVLHVYNWSDYVAEDTISRFTEETGIEVVYDVYDGNEVVEAKLTAGKSGYDVIFPSARPFVQRHVASKLYLPLDKSKLPNLVNLDPILLKSLEDVDPGNAHVIPYMWGTTGIGYNRAEIKKALGENIVVDSWSILFDPANAAKLKKCGIAILDDEQEGFGAAAIFLGKDPNMIGGDLITATQGMYQSIYPNIRYFNSSKFKDDLANGEICIAMGYNGDVLQARDLASEAGNGVEIAYAIPKEGALRWVDTIAIPADAPHPNNAHVFLNFLMRPDVIAPITDFVSYANANAKATELVNEEIRNDQGVYPSTEVIAKLVDPSTLPDDESRARVRAWTSIKSGQ